MSLNLRFQFIVLLFWVIKPEQSFAAFSSGISTKENSKPNVYSSKQAFKLQKLQYKFGVEPNDRIEIPRKRFLLGGAFGILFGSVMSFYVLFLGITFIVIGLIYLVLYARNKKITVSPSKLAKVAMTVAVVMTTISGILFIIGLFSLINFLGKLH